VLVSLLSMIYYNLEIAGLFAVILAVGYVYFQMTHSNRATPGPDAAKIETALERS
jgi:ethanolamine permease